MLIINLYLQNNDVKNAPFIAKKHLKGETEIRRKIGKAIFL